VTLRQQGHEAILLRGIEKGEPSGEGSDARAPRARQRVAGSWHVRTAKAGSTGGSLCLDCFGISIVYSRIAG
jgi:hypothetical protein